MINFINKTVVSILEENISETFFVVSEEQDNYEQVQKRGFKVDLEKFFTERNQLPLTFIGIQSISTDTSRMSNYIDKGSYKPVDLFRTKFKGLQVTSCQLIYAIRTYCADMLTALEKLEAMFFFPREYVLNYEIGGDKGSCNIKSLVTNFEPPTLNLKYGRNKYYMVGLTLQVDGWVAKNIEVPALQRIDIKYYSSSGELLEQQNIR